MNNRPTYQFANSFTISYPSRELWASEDLYRKLLESVVFFSGGSRSQFNAGYGTYCPTSDLRGRGTLGNLCTIFQAEIIALTHCVLEALKIADKNLVFCTDSKAVLNALNNPLTNSKLVKDCKYFLNLLCANNRVTLLWVPAHCNIEGNEIADSLAKEGAQLHLTGTKPVVPVSYDSAIKAIKRYPLAKLKEVWRTASTCRTAKLFISKPISGVTKYALSLKKNQLRILIGIITGHARFKVHLMRLGRVHDTVCEDCLEGDDDSVHYVCTCPAFGRARLRIFNSETISANQLLLLPLFKLIQFAKAAARICEL